MDDEEFFLTKGWFCANPCPKCKETGKMLVGFEEKPSKMMTKVTVLCTECHSEWIFDVSSRAGMTETVNEWEKMVKNTGVKKAAKMFDNEIRTKGGIHVEVDADWILIELVRWIQDWFKKNGPNSKAVIGMSGGKDSLTCAMLCIKALGKDRVEGVIMPMIGLDENGKRRCIGEEPDKAIAQCRKLGIEYRMVNILPAVKALTPNGASEQTRTNLPCRVRGAELYAISQTVGGRVVCTSNRSEDYIGWNTRWGDNIGDLQPLGGLTCTEVYKLLLLMLSQGDEWTEDELPDVPKDGLCGRTDEEAFGFTYADLDRWILTKTGDPKITEKIEQMYAKSRFKMRMPDRPDLTDTD